MKYFARNVFQFSMCTIQHRLNVAAWHTGNDVKHINQATTVSTVYARSG